MSSMTGYNAANHSRKPLRQFGFDVSRSVPRRVAVTAVSMFVLLLSEGLGAHDSDDVLSHVPSNADACLWTDNSDQLLRIVSKHLHQQANLNSETPLGLQGQANSTDCLSEEDYSTICSALADGTLAGPSAFYWMGSNECTFVIRLDCCEGKVNQIANALTHAATWFTKLDLSYSINADETRGQYWIVIETRRDDRDAISGPASQVAESITASIDYLAIRDALPPAEPGDARFLFNTGSSKRLALQFVRSLVSLDRQRHYQASVRLARTFGLINLKAIGGQFKVGSVGTDHGAIDLAFEAIALFDEPLPESAITPCPLEKHSLQGIPAQLPSFSSIGIIPIDSRNSRNMIEGTLDFEWLSPSQLTSLDFENGVSSLILGNANDATPIEGSNVRPFIAFDLNHTIAETESLAVARAILAISIAKDVVNDPRPLLGEIRLETANGLMHWRPSRDFASAAASEYVVQFGFDELIRAICKEHHYFLFGVEPTENWLANSATIELERLLDKQTRVFQSLALQPHYQVSQRNSSYSH